MNKSVMPRYSRGIKGRSTVSISKHTTQPTRPHTPNPTPFCLDESGASRKGKKGGKRGQKGESSSLLLLLLLLLATPTTIDRVLRVLVMEIHPDLIHRLGHRRGPTTQEVETVPTPVARPGRFVENLVAFPLVLVEGQQQLLQLQWTRRPPKLPPRPAVFALALALANNGSLKELTRVNHLEQPVFVLAARWAVAVFGALHPQGLDELVPVDGDGRRAPFELVARPDEPLVDAGCHVDELPAGGVCEAIDGGDVSDGASSDELGGDRERWAWRLGEVTTFEGSHLVHGVQIHAKEFAGDRGVCIRRVLDSHDASMIAGGAL